MATVELYNRWFYRGKCIGSLWKRQQHKYAGHGDCSVCTIASGIV